MELTLLNESFYRNLAACKYEKNSILTLYYDNFLHNASDVLKNYLEYYVPFDEETLSNRVYYSCMFIRSEIDKIDKLIKNELTEPLNKIKKELGLRDNILDSIIVNLFLGANTCDAFTIVNENHCSINIAIERILKYADPHKILNILLMHELVHVLRIKHNLTTNNCTLGSMLIEEGIACIMSREILGLEPNDSDYILPETDYIYDTLKILKKPYLQYFDSTDQNLISILLKKGAPDNNTESGAGYFVAADIMDSYISKNRTTVYDIFWKKCDEIYNSIKKQMNMYFYK